MKYTNKVIGDLGEKAAVKFLKKNKYKILETNFSSKTGEIDIICVNKNYVVFVEVKTRKVDGLASGVYAVNDKKQQHIIKTASAYLFDNKSDKQPRFDVIEVEFDEKLGSAKVTDHIVDAFVQGGKYAIF